MTSRARPAGPPAAPRSPAGCACRGSRAARRAAGAPGRRPGPGRSRWSADRRRAGTCGGPRRPWPRRRRGPSATRPPVITVEGAQAPPATRATEPDGPDPARLRRWWRCSSGARTRCGGCPAAARRRAPRPARSPAGPSRAGARATWSCPSRWDRSRSPSSPGGWKVPCEHARHATGHPDLVDTPPPGPPPPRVGRDTLASPTHRAVPLVESAHLSVPSGSTSGGRGPVVAAAEVPPGRAPGPDEHDEDPPHAQDHDRPGYLSTSHYFGFIGTI